MGPWAPRAEEQVTCGRPTRVWLSVKVVLTPQLRRHSRLGRGCWPASFAGLGRRGESQPGAWPRWGFRVYSHTSGCIAGVPAGGKESVPRGCRRQGAEPLPGELSAGGVASTGPPRAEERGISSGAALRDLQSKTLQEAGEHRSGRLQGGFCPETVCFLLYLSQ